MTITGNKLKHPHARNKTYIMTTTNNSLNPKQSFFDQLKSDEDIGSPQQLSAQHTCNMGLNNQKYKHAHHRQNSDFLQVSSLSNPRQAENYFRNVNVDYLRMINRSKLAEKVSIELPKTFEL